MAASDSVAGVTNELIDKARAMARTFSQQHGVEESFVFVLLMDFGRVTMDHVQSAQGVVLKRVLERGGG
jgi:hypothetical protein